MKKKQSSKKKQLRPIIFKLTENQSDIIMQEMPRGYKLMKYQTLRNIELEYHKDKYVFPFLYPGSSQIPQSSLIQTMKQLSKHQKAQSKNPLKLQRQPILDANFEPKKIIKKKLNDFLDRIKKDKVISSIKNQSLKRIFTKQLQKITYLFNPSKTTFDLKCYLVSGFDTFFYNSDETDTVNNKMKIFQTELLAQLLNFKEQIEEKPKNNLQNEQIINLINSTEINQPAVINLSNANFTPYLIDLARKINLGYNFQKLNSQQLSKICQKYYFSKSYELGGQWSQYQVQFQSLSLRQFMQLQNQVKSFLKQRNLQFELIQDSTKSTFIIEDDN